MKRTTLSNRGIFIQSNLLYTLALLIAGVVGRGVVGRWMPKRCRKKKKTWVGNTTFPVHILPSILPCLRKSQVPAVWKAWRRHQNFLDNWTLSQYSGAVAFVGIITFRMFYVFECQICWCVQPGVFLSLRNKFWQLLHIRYWVGWNFMNWLCAYTWKGLLNTTPRFV